MVSQRCVFLLLGACTSSLGAQMATLTVVDPPSVVTSGEPFSITVEYTADLASTGHRGVLLLDILDAGDQSTVMTLDDDNGLQGFEGPVGSHVFNVTLPTDSPPEIFFRACLTVFGLNDWVQARLLTYPTDGTYPYEWTGNGITQDLYYLGGLVISNNSGNRTYCSGITFETFLLSYEHYLDTQGLPPQIDAMTTTDAMRSFRRLWYGATGVPIEDEFQSTLAIERHGLGFILDDFADARAGDFVQLWRHSGSGHNLIFQSWGRDGDGQTDRINYWSSQSATNGIGFRGETVSDTWGVDPSRLHIARVMKPRAPDDWDLRFGDVDTSASPTAVVSGVAAAGILLR